MGRDDEIRDRLGLECLGDGKCWYYDPCDVCREWTDEGPKDAAYLLAEVKRLREALETAARICESDAWTLPAARAAQIRALTEPSP